MHEKKRDNNEDETRKMEDPKGKGGGRLKHRTIDGDLSLCLRKTEKESNDDSSSKGKTREENESGSSTLNKMKHRDMNKMASGTDWNPELSTRYRINRAIEKPRKRWEDDINEFLKQEFEDTKNPIESSNQTNKTWISSAKDIGSWALLEEVYTMTVEERQEMRKKEHDQRRPARYFDGVRLSDEETANIT